MKRQLFFTLALVCSVFAFAQEANNDWRIHPDDAQYKIYGNFQTTFPNGDISYELTNVEPVGLSFPIQSKYFGGETTLGNVYFTFDHVTSSGEPDFEHIALWVFDEALNKWVPDEETGKDTVNASNTNEMTVVLVLDCSSSLSTQGFEDVKTSAKSFIDVMLQSSTSGNIHIGIIGFSTIQQTRFYDLQPLTYYTSFQMKSFVDELTQGNGTALYYSFDKAFDMTQDYANKLKKFSGAAIVSFTDGLDNGSINREKRIGSKENYYKHIKENVLYQSINGIPFLSYTIFVEGGADVKDDMIKNKIVEELRIIAKQYDTNEKHFFSVNNTSQLVSQFRLIAKNLINSWKVLSCFISAGQNGKVCWTFGKKEITKPKPIIGRPLLIGGNLGLGLPMEFGYANGAGLDFQIGFDFAYPLTDRFAIGFYTSLGGGFTGGEIDYYYNNYSYLGGMFKFTAGLLMEMGDLNDRPFLLGISPCAGICLTGGGVYLPLEVRFGRVFSNNMYIVGNLTCGFLDGCYLEPTIHVGYNFGHKVKR